MRINSILNADEINRKTIGTAKEMFIKQCKLKNLSAQTIKYYVEDIDYFATITKKKYADELTQEVYEDFVVGELDKGKKTTSLNTRIRGLRVFLTFCAEREMIKPYKISLLKCDEEIKEPYTDTEIEKLLRKPHTNRWAEWRNWAIVNYMVATGNRRSTVINLKIEDINFEEMKIHLRKVKNRRQQLVPLSPALKKVLTTYLSTWTWEKDDYLFPTNQKQQMRPRTIEIAVARYNQSRGVEKTSCHLFRHYYSKHFILNGGQPLQLQMLLGHSTLDMTRHYVNLYGTELRKDYDKLNPLDTFYHK